MSNQFLSQIHDHISTQIEKTLFDKARAQNEGDRERVTFLTGRADEMMSVRDFLSRNFDLATQKYY